MREYTVTFALDEAQVQQLQAVTELYNHVLGDNITPGHLLEVILTTGSASLFADRLQYWKTVLEREQAKREGTLCE
jgi:Trp operon repressor